MTGGDGGAVVAAAAAAGAPPPEAAAQPDGSWLLRKPDGGGLRYTQRSDGSWRKPERLRGGGRGARGGGATARARPLRDGRAARAGPAAAAAAAPSATRPSGAHTGGPAPAASGDDPGPDQPRVYDELKAVLAALCVRSPQRVESRRKWAGGRGSLPLPPSWVVRASRQPGWLACRATPEEREFLLRVEDELRGFVSQQQQQQQQQGAPAPAAARPSCVFPPMNGHFRRLVRSMPPLPPLVRGCLPRALRTAAVAAAPG
jgi:hypothetical protein